MKTPKRILFVAAFGAISTLTYALDVNLNTGEPLNQNRRWRIADNAVYHDAQHPSRIILPIIPSSGTSQAGPR